ncbi:MAG TPA: hypothetical protein VG897_01500, partial [Terriglobales bacterium]|nr:hypothetical protein [Terriglobales bacterium]
FTSTDVSSDVAAGRLKAWPLTAPSVCVGISIVWLRTRALSRPLKWVIRILKQQHEQYLRACPKVWGISPSHCAVSNRAVCEVGFSHADDSPSLPRSSDERSAHERLLVGRK